MSSMGYVRARLGKNHRGLMLNLEQIHKTDIKVILFTPPFGWRVIRWKYVEYRVEYPYRAFHLTEFVDRDQNYPRK